MNPVTCPSVRVREPSPQAHSRRTFSAAVDTVVTVTVDTVEIRSYMGSTGSTTVRSGS